MSLPTPMAPLLSCCLDLFTMYYRTSHILGGPRNSKWLPQSRCHCIDSNTMGACQSRRDSTLHSAVGKGEGVLPQTATPLKKGRSLKVPSSSTSPPPFSPEQPTLPLTPLAEAEREEDDSSGGGRKSPDQSTTTSYSLLDVCDLKGPPETAPPPTSANNRKPWRPSNKMLKALLDGNRTTNPGSVVMNPSSPARRNRRSAGFEDDGDDGLSSISKKSSALPENSVASEEVSTLAQFHKLKIQVQLAQRAQKHERKKEKIQKRIQETAALESQWSDLEQIQHEVAVAKRQRQDHPDDEASVGSGMSLNNPGTWWFDFSTMQEMEKKKRKPAHDDDENTANPLIGTHLQVFANMDDDNMSFMSDASREAQRKYFEGKRRQRKRKRKNKTEKKKPSLRLSAGHVPTGPAFQGQTREDDYGPQRQTPTARVQSPVDNDDADSQDTPPRTNVLHSQNSSNPLEVLASWVFPSKDKAPKEEDQWMPMGDYNVRRPRRRRSRMERGNDDDSSFSSWRTDDNDDASSLSTHDDWRLKVHADLEEYRKSYSTGKPKEESELSKRIRELSKLTSQDKYGFDPSSPLDFDKDLPVVETPSPVKKQQQLLTEEEELPHTPKYGAPPSGVSSTLDTSVWSMSSPSFLLLQSFNRTLESNPDVDDHQEEENTERADVPQTPKTPQSNWIRRSRTRKPHNPSTSAIGGLSPLEMARLSTDGFALMSALQCATSIGDEGSETRPKLECEDAHSLSSSDSTGDDGGSDHRPQSDESGAISQADGEVDEENPPFIETKLSAVGACEDDGLVAVEIETNVKPDDRDEEEKKEEADEVQ